MVFLAPLEIAMASKKASPRSGGTASPEETHEEAKQPQSRAEEMQALTMAPSSEDRLPVTLRARNSYEYHLDLARSVVVALLDPDVPDAFIEVPCSVRGTRRFLHTSEIKEIDVKAL